jgi:hypothetical protein
MDGPVPDPSTLEADDDDMVSANWYINGSC